MRKNVFLLILLFFVEPLLANAEDLETGKWNFFIDDDYCFIGSLPTEKDVPKGKNRGDTYILVYRMNKSPEAVVQIDAGYPYNQEKSVEVKIDKKIYEFYSQDDSAWTKNDKQIILAMKKGIKLTVKGYSSRGTLTIDTYTLNGFTSAYNKLSKGC